MSEQFKRKVLAIPGAKLSPKTVLGRTISKSDRIRNVVVLIQWDDESWAADWSEMKNSEFSLAIAVAQEHLFRMLAESWMPSGLADEPGPDGPTG